MLYLHAVGYCLILAFLVLYLFDSIVGNPMICGVKSGDNCSSVSMDPLSYPPDDLKSEILFIIELFCIVLSICATHICFLFLSSATTRHRKKPPYSYYLWSHCWFGSICNYHSQYASLVAA